MGKLRRRGEMGRVQIADRRESHRFGDSLTPMRQFLCGQGQSVSSCPCLSVLGLFALFCTCLFAQVATLQLHTLADTGSGMAPVYAMGLLPWHDPLDTTIAFSWRMGYYKPYSLWQDGALLYESELSVFPFTQAVYLTTGIPVIWSRLPYTRVRFDQSSRKTQLLSVQHGQTFGRGAGVSFRYQRRTRTGEYVGQTTDHYGTGLTLYVMPGKGWIRLSAGWNQLQDGINGGVIYTDSPQDGFLKERQLVRMNGASLRRWYRFAEGEVGRHLGRKVALAFTARLTEDRVEKRAPPALRSESPLSSDTMSMTMGVRQVRQQAGIKLWLGRWQTHLRYNQYKGVADTVLITGWHFSAVEGGTALHLPHFSAELRYRHWIEQGSPPPAIEGELRWHPRRYELGVLYMSRNLPWLAYQSSIILSRPVNERLMRLWAALHFPTTDTTLPPFKVIGWVAQWMHPWLALPTFGQTSTIVSAGIRLQGGWRKGTFGLLTGINAQRLFTGPTPWRAALPAASGWIQPFLRWQLPGKPPVYQLGVRFSGVTSLTPLAYDVVLGAFYGGVGAVPSTQRAYIWADPYFVVLIRRVMVYLRVEHVTEGLLAPGYYLTAWYPMPGRAFSFGVQWDIYN